MAKSSTSFKTGNPGGNGRLPRVTERAYIDCTIGNCSIEQWALVTQRAVEDAINGDWRAREWLTKLLVGNDPILMIAVIEDLRSKLATIEVLSGIAEKRDRLFERPPPRQVG